MSKKIKLIIFLVLLSQLSYLKAQVNPPNLICVKNDSLIWEVPGNNCGPFMAYDIFFSNNIDGPYTLLTSITNPVVTSFKHENPNADIWYYYLQSNYDCPGEPVLTSDTLDNLIPIAGPIRSVSITDDEQVRIDWEPSPSPEVFAYIISRNTQLGTTIIDTVFGATFYIDENASPDELSETYFVVALDRCGNTSLVGTPQNTLFLTNTEAMACQRSITLTWNPYENWPNGVASHEILLSINDGDQIIVDTVDGNATSYVFENVSNLDVYCFRVRAMQEGSTITSTSNEICQIPEVIQGVHDHLLINVSATENNEVQLEWVWDPTAALSELDIQSSIDSINFISVNNPLPAFPLTMENDYVDGSNNPALGPIAYQIETIDECDLLLHSNILTTLFLQGQVANAGENMLEWTDFDQNENITTEAYEVYRLAGNSTILLGTTPVGTFSFNDFVDVTNPEESIACYFVVAISDVTMPDGSTRQIRSRSNTVCIQQKAQLFVPNAFVPDGVNKEFFPILQFGSPSEYFLFIYDRYGGKLFESQSIEIGWNGKSNGKLMPQGVYAYYIRLVQTDGQVVEQRGNVLLLR